MASGRQYTIGIAGGIACGKSTVCKILAASGVVHIACDSLTHEAQQQPQVFSALVEAFGDKIILDRKKCLVDRKALGALAFADPDKMALLGELTGEVYQELLNSRLAGAGDCIVALEAASPSWWAGVEVCCVMSGSISEILELETNSMLLCRSMHCGSSLLSRISKSSD